MQNTPANAITARLRGADRNLPQGSVLTQLFSAPTVDTFQRAARVRTVKITLLGALASLTLGGLFLFQGFDSLLIPLMVLLALTLPVILWHYSRAILYIVIGSAAFFELFPSPYSDSLTERVPFFWNINTIVQVYAGANFKAVPLNFLEVLLVLACLCSAVRAIFGNKVSLHGGPLLIPILVYLGFVLLAWANGMLTGGDFKNSLQEVRSQIYFVVAYLLAANLVTERRHERKLLWITLICVGIKGILLTFRRYVTIGGQPLPEQGVGSHEDAFLFSLFMLALMIFALYKSHRGMQRMALILLPTVMLGNLACNRRAGTAAMAIAIPIVLLTAYVTLPAYRRVIGSVTLALAVGGMMYYQVFKKSPSPFAQPARAIHSQFAPDERDASSNAYRLAENANQMATLRSSPIIGYGYGKRFFHAVPIADIAKIYEWWDLLPHNQILWVWMRTGTLGFFAFWMMMSAIIIRACRLARARVDAESKALAVLGLCSIVILLVFGLLDLQLSNYRDMLIAGCFAGLLSSRLYPAHLDVTAITPVTPAERAEQAMQPLERVSS